MYKNANMSKHGPMQVNENFKFLGVFSCKKTQMQSTISGKIPTPLNTKINPPIRCFDLERILFYKFKSS